MICHTASPCMRTSGVVRREVCEPMYRPTATAAVTPESPSSSAGRYAA